MDAQEHDQQMEEVTGQTRPTGPAAAALLAAGVGSVALGVLTTLAEASEGVKAALQFTEPVGPLSGKTTGAVAAFLLAWAVGHMTMSDRSPRLRGVLMWTIILVALGLIMTFPPVFGAFATE